jgi:Fe-S cluster assembly protein SufD
MSAVIDFPVKPEARDYLACFAADPNEPAWLGERRRQGITRFAELGWPTRRNESWRYLDLSTAGRLRPAKAPLQSADVSLKSEISALSLAEAGQRIVLVNGRFVPELSALMPTDGVWLASTVRAIRERPDLARRVAEKVAIGDSESFDALNAAFFSDGFVFEVAAGIVLDRPIEIIHLAIGADDTSFHTRSLIALGAGSRASVIETYAGNESRYWLNDFVSVRLGDNAELIRTLLVEEAAKAAHLDELSASLGAGARLNHFALLIGGRTVRHEANVQLAGEGAHCELDGAFIVAGRDEANIVTTVDHAAPGGETRELVKGVGADRGHGAFQGRIIVRPGAQKTDAKQTSRNLIIGNRAVIDTKPELEIYADDVKCAHGASVGDLDETALFYLRARGIPDAEARQMLIEGFVREAIETIEQPVIRNHLLKRLAGRLSQLEASS